LTDGTPLSKDIIDDWKSAITFPNPLTDFGAAVGRTQIVSDGMFTMTRQGNYFLVKGTVNLQLEDRFDFNPGKKFPVPVSPFVLSADDLNLLEKCKGAKPFIQAIKWKQEVSGRATLSQMHEQRPLQWDTIP
jgi:hypothetical protein